MSLHKGILGQAEGGASVSGRKEDTTLGDYINRKLKHEAFNTVYTECCGNPLRGCVSCPPPKKLTFEQWLEDSQVGYRSVETKADLVHYLKLAWQAAQENK